MSGVRLALVGFGPFPGAPANPSAVIARRIAERGARRFAGLGAGLRALVLPTVHEAVAPGLAGLFEDWRPHAVLLIGLAGRRRRVSVETRAVNRLSLFAPDAAGRRAGRIPIAPGEPLARRARAPLAALVAAIRRATPAGLSIDAGRYVCNLALWEALGAGAGSRPAALVAFLHVPTPRRAGTPSARGRARPPLESLIEGAAAALVALLVAARRQASQSGTAAA